jgi:hypothetical protein
VNAADVIGDSWVIARKLGGHPGEPARPEFFILSTRIAGEVIQKFVNYRQAPGARRRHFRAVGREFGVAAFVYECKQRPGRLVPRRPMANIR